MAVLHRFYCINNIIPVTLRLLVFSAVSLLFDNRLNQDQAWLSDSLVVFLKDVLKVCFEKMQTTANKSYKRTGLLA